MSKLRYSVLWTILMSSLVSIFAAKNEISLRKSSITGCGVQHNFTGNVFNGQNVTRYEFPWKAALMLNINGDYEFICGGVLIDDETVVTAAHCIRTSPENQFLVRDLAIALGSHDISKKREIGSIFLGIKSIHIHDNWNPGNDDFDGDIAVIKLTDSVYFTNYIRPVCLDMNLNLNLNLRKIGIVAGWGYHDDSHKISNLPRKVELPIVSDRECFKKDHILAKIIWDEAFCAGKDGAGVCKGDSGSGFYVESNGILYLRGIVSSSVVRPCSQTSMTIYSDVLKYTKFIGKFAKIDVPTSFEDDPDDNLNSKSDDMQPRNSYDLTAKCFSEHQRYSCRFEKFNIQTPDFNVGNIITEHESSDKTEADVDAFYFKNANITAVPQLDKNLLNNRFVNLNYLHIEGGGEKEMGKKWGTVPFQLNENSLWAYSAFEGIYLGWFGDKLTELPEKLLWKNSELTRFASGGNAVKKIPDRFFSQNKRLEEVALYSSEIDYIQENLFSFNRKLTRINMSYNRIKALPSNLISQNVRLAKFDISHNNLTSIPNLIFKNNLELIRVEIRSNQLRSLPFNLLKTLRDLTYFQADYNQIISIPQNFFDNNPNLEEVNLAHNNILKLDEDLFFRNIKLQTIDISDNKIKTLPPNLIRNCPLLNKFLVKDNQIIDIPENFTEKNSLLKVF